MFPCPGTLKHGGNPAQLHTQGPLVISELKTNSTMRQVIIFLFLFIPFFSIAQLLEYENPHLKGQYKECNEQSFSYYEYEDTFEIGELITHWSRGLAKYDNERRITEFTYQPYSFMSEKVKISYFYDNDGNLKEKKYYDTSGKMDRHFYFKCDKSGKIIEEKRYQFNLSDDVIRTMEYFYNENNRLIQIDNIGADNVISSSEYFEYDTSGYLIMNKDFGEYLYENDDQGNPLIKYLIESDGSKTITYEGKFNDINLLVEEKMYFHGNFAGTFYYSYELDSIGNWISRKKYFSDNTTNFTKKADQITLREIKYF
jgi:hypothetical protein